MSDQTSDDACLDENLLVELLEGRLDDAARARIDRHVDRCHACRALLAASAAEPGDAEPKVRGTRFARYLILDVVGVGGNGVVYAAYDPELDRKVAIKVLRPLHDDDLRRTRTLREAQAMARLSHRNVVSVHDVGTLDDQVFTVMEFVEGVTLTQWCAAAPRSWRDLVGVFVEAGRGLAAAHGAGLVHRDFKPDNVLIGADGRVLVTDFGLARAAGAPAPAPPGAEAPRPRLATTTSMRTDAVAGTPAYMSPEQLRGEPLDARSDLFSFCVALYEALYQRRPFAGDTVAQIQAHVLAGDILPPPRGAQVPAFVQRALVRGLHAQPAARFASMTELLQALRRAPARRLTAAALAAVALALAYTATLGAWRWHDERAQVCSGAGRLVGEVWNPTRQDAVHAAFAATARPFAEDAFGAVRGGLERYAAAWTAMRTEACEATRLRREQSEELMELRLACLDHRLAEMNALVALFAAADADTVDTAARAAYKLSPLGQCADAEALRAPVPPPREPGARAQVEALRTRLAQVKALRDLGRYREQAERAAELVAAAHDLGYRPLEAEAQLLQGMALDINSDYAHAADALRSAVWAAEEGHDLALAVRARAELVWAAHELGKPELGEEYARDAQALLVGLGGDPELEALIADTRSMVLDDQGQAEESMKLAQVALDKRLVVLGPDHPQTAISMVNVAVGYSIANRPADALPLYQRALAVYAKAFGPHHPLYAHTLFNIADALMNLGRDAEARTQAEQALTVIEAALGKEHALVASAKNVLGLIATRQGRVPDAVELLQGALDLAARVRGPRHPFVADYALNLGQALCAGGRDAEALPLFQRAESIFREAGNPVFAARALSAAGKAQLATGARAQAITALEAALQVQEADDKGTPELAVTRFTLARALWPGADPTRARALAQAALAELAAQPTADPAARAEVERWLAAAR